MSVLTVITRRSGALTLARLGYRIARAREEKLIVLCLEKGEAAAEAVTIVPGEVIPEGVSATVVAICGELARGPQTYELRGDDGADPEPEVDRRVVPDPEIEVLRMVSSDRLGSALQAVRDVGATYLIAAKHKPRSKRVPLARKLFTAAPCHTLLTRLGDPDEEDTGLLPALVAPGKPILVPTAGGPHAAEALRLGERLASAEGGRVVALYVKSAAGELADAVGERYLNRVLADVGIEGSRFVEPRVELDEEPSKAIARIAEEGFDLMLLGDSSAGSLRRRLFGTVPEHLLGEDRLQVAVVRREWKLFHRLRRQLGRWLDLTIPQMTRAERIALYDKLQSGSLWNFDFMTLISLSTAIAALGLLQDSAAVVIGAMLVAPLMTPILGAGLALVQGNFPLLKVAGQAIVFGYLMALTIGLAAGLMFPIPELTPQLEARGGPTLLDLGVAFLSGLAAAFCLSRPGLLAALPGVAIAAALVPPIATTGVSLALSELKVAKGSALLFATNVVAIILGAAVSLYASGVRGRSGAASHQKWVTNAFLVLLLGTVALFFPLGSELRSQLSGGSGFELPVTLEQRLTERLARSPGCRLSSILSRRQGGQLVLTLVLESPRPPSPELTRDLAGVARDDLGQDLVVRVETRLLTEVR